MRSETRTRSILFLQIYRREGIGHKMSYKDPKPARTCAIVRYGGFGDMLQASSIIPGLKDQGYHVTVFTTPRGFDIVKNDPNIDRFHLQDQDQVPNEELTAFWEVHTKKYDKFIQLSENGRGYIPGAKRTP